MWDLVKAGLGVYACALGAVSQTALQVLIILAYSLSASTSCATVCIFALSAPFLITADTCCGLCCPRTAGLLFKHACKLFHFLSTSSMLQERPSPAICLELLAPFAPGKRPSLSCQCNAFRQHVSAEYTNNHRN